MKVLNESKQSQWCLRVGCALNVSSCSVYIHWKIPFRCLLRRTSDSALVRIVSIKVATASANMHLGKVQEGLSYIITFRMSKVLPAALNLWKSTNLEAEIILELFELQFWYIQRTASTMMFVIFFCYL